MIWNLSDSQEEQRKSIIINTYLHGGQLDLKQYISLYFSEMEFKEFKPQFKSANPGLN